MEYAEQEQMPFKKGMSLDTIERSSFLWMHYIKDSTIEDFISANGLDGSVRDIMSKFGTINIGGKQCDADKFLNAMRAHRDLVNYFSFKLTADEEGNVRLYAYIEGNAYHLRMLKASGDRNADLLYRAIVQQKKPEGEAIAEMPVVDKKFFTWNKFDHLDPDYVGEWDI